MGLGHLPTRTRYFGRSKWRASVSPADGGARSDLGGELNKYPPLARFRYASYEAYFDSLYDKGD